MKIYLIEKGFCRQSGEIVGAFVKLSDALNEYERIQESEKSKANTVITFGIMEEDKTPGVLFGFWSGTTPGNVCANGWRVREIDAKE